MSTQTFGGHVQIAPAVQLITEKIPSRVQGVEPLWIAYPREHITLDDLFDRAAHKWGMGSTHDSVVVAALMGTTMQATAEFIDHAGPAVTVNVDGAVRQGIAHAVVPSPQGTTYYVRLDTGERVVVTQANIISIRTR